MPIETRLLMALASLTLMAVIIYLVRRRRLDEKYAVLWLGVGAVMLLAPLSVRMIDLLSRGIGIHYPPAFVFLVGFLGLCLINLQFSVVISRLSRENRVMARKLALIEEQVESMTEGTGSERALETLE